MNFCTRQPPVWHKRKSHLSHFRRTTAECEVLVPDAGQTVCSLHFEEECAQNALYRLEPARIMLARRFRKKVDIHPSRRAGSRRPVMPLLFSIGIQGAVEQVSRSLKAGGHLCGFFDVHLVCEPDRVRFLYDKLAEALSTVAGIRLHQGKTRVWNTISQCPTADLAICGAWMALGTPWGAQSSSRPPQRKESERN